MNLHDFLDPVALEKPPVFFIPEEFTFARNITIHTPNFTISDLSKYKIAIVGVPFDGNSLNRGSWGAPNIIRSKLYQLNRINGANIIDLGNLKTGKTAKDVYFGLREVLIELFARKIIVILIGGTQDLTYGISLAYEHLNVPVSLVTIDSHIDLSMEKEEISSQNYLNKIILEHKKRVFDYINIGHQAYFADETVINLLQKSHYNSYRLGSVRGNLQMTEPLIRDANIVSFDMSAVKQAYAPGNIKASPNGLSGSEACQISRYAGLSPDLPVFGIFETNPELDFNYLTAQLAAQMIWYFIEGVNQRVEEHPLNKNSTFTKFIVNSHKFNGALNFYKSERTERWWVEIPLLRSSQKQIYISCSHADYQDACKDEIPMRWIQAFQKFN